MSQMRAGSAGTEEWPSLRWEEWSETAETLHMWMQIVGKVRLALSPKQQHWWNVPLYVSARGLSTSAMPYEGELLEIEFDFVSHTLQYRMSTGATLSTPLRAQSVRDFYAEFKHSMAALDVQIEIHPVPVELKDPIPFSEDTKHAAYDAEAAHRFWRVLISADRVFQQFSSSFVGKISPVHFFWGSFDLAVSRFSGRPAAVRADADGITREAYSEEVISAGFWPGNGGFGEAAFYSYTVPAPEGLAGSAVTAPGLFNPSLGEFVLKYEDLRRESDPAAILMQFLQSTYEAGAKLAGWDRGALERAVNASRPS